MKIFNLDSPLMRFLEKMADLMWLNILTLICCIPLFTVGTAFTALHYMALKIVRNEECYITRGYFKSFKENFAQSTLIWLLLIVVAAVLAGDFYIMMELEVEVNRIVRLIIAAIAVLALFTAAMVFPMQAKFANPISRTLKNAFVVGILQFPKTFLMMVLLPLPLVLCYLSWRLVPVAVLFGLSVPAYLSAMLYNKTFLKMEEQFLAANAPEGEMETEEEEPIFSDTPMETMEEK